MCGIAGIVSLKPVPPGLLGRMLDIEAHRGPDGSGQWLTKPTSGEAQVLLGHRRLSIIDIGPGGQQPMTDASGDLTITYNGEIYNYIELRAELAGSGHSFRSESDTEVLLAAYQTWGTDCLSRFNGMYSLAIHDRRRGVLFCARDRYGEKPFLFAVGAGFFIFASEYKAVLLHPDLSLAIDEHRLLQAAYNPSTGLDGDRQTVFTDVQQLLPGEAMELDLGTLKSRIWRYWQLEPRAVAPVTNEVAIFDVFRELLIDSVRIRMRSDVTVGSCLSGGLDSSAIVCIARTLIGDDAEYHTFTGRFPDTPADEWSWAAQVVEATGVVSHVVEPTVGGLVRELPTFIWHNELPVGSSSQYAQWNVFRLAREHGVTVLLDGQGADEILGGYEQYFARYVEALAATGDTARMARELPLIRERYPLALTPPERALRDRLPYPIRHALSNRLGMGTSLLYGLRIPIGRQIAAESALPTVPGFNPLTNALAQDSFGRFLTTLLRYGDRNSMAHAREVRLPFCDYRIAEFVAGLPPHMVMGEVQTKRLLRESLRGILPEGVRTRWNKQGFRPPQDLWFKDAALLGLVSDTFASQSFRTSPFWIPGWWQRALERVVGGELDLGWTLWQPLMIEQWRVHFLEQMADRRRNLMRSAA